jgi:tetrahydromethanopterin S-methyltransferase subunit G
MTYAQAYLLGIAFGIVVGLTLATVVLAALGGLP